MGLCDKERMKKFLTKQRSLVLSGYFANLSATWTAVILIYPGLGTVQNLEEAILLLTKNLPWVILSLATAVRLADEAR